MICIGIPVCRPLYKRFLDKLTSGHGSGSGGYKKQTGSGNGLGGGGSGGPRYVLRTFGGSTMPGVTKSRYESEAESARDRRDRGDGSDDTDDVGSDTSGGGHGHGGAGGNNKRKSLRMDLKLGINGPFTETTAVAGGDVCAPDNGSQEEILGDEFRTGGHGGPGKKRADLEAGKAHHGQPKASIQVTEEWRVDRT